MKDEELDKFIDTWNQKMRKRYPPMLLTPLPRKVRFRLWVNRQIDLSGITLCSISPACSKVAGWMWRFAEKTGVYYNAR